MAWASSPCVPGPSRPGVFQENGRDGRSTHGQDARATHFEIDFWNTHTHPGGGLMQHSRLLTRRHVPLDAAVGTATVQARKELLNPTMAQAQHVLDDDSLRVIDGFIDLSSRHGGLLFATLTTRFGTVTAARTSGGEPPPPPSGRRCAGNAQPPSPYVVGRRIGGKVQLVHKRQTHKRRIPNIFPGTEFAGRDSGGFSKVVHFNSSLCL